MASTVDAATSATSLPPPWPCSQSASPTGELPGGPPQDGVKAAAAAVNGNNSHQGTRPGLGLDRKRPRFTLMPPQPQSNPVENVDYSQLLTIEDPDEYVSTLDRLEEHDKEIKRLRGEVPTKRADHHGPVEPGKKRPIMPRRKSVYSYNFSANADLIGAPVSQTETRTESQSTKDDMAPSVPERTRLPVPSSSSQCDIPDHVSVGEGSFAEQDNGATLDELFLAFKNLDESEEENLLLETLQIKETNIGKVCLPDLLSAPVDRHVSSSTRLKHLTSGHTPERSAPGSYLAQISKWEKLLLGRNFLDNKANLSEDDGSDSSPGTVTGKRSWVHNPYDAVVLTGGEASTAKETPTSNMKSPDHVLEPVQNIPNGVSADESEPRSASFGVCIDSEVAKENDASSGHNVSLEEDDVPLNHPVIEKSNHESKISSPGHLEGDTTEELG